MQKDLQQGFARADALNFSALKYLAIWMNLWPRLFLRHPQMNLLEGTNQLLLSWNRPMETTPAGVK